MRDSVVARKYARALFAEAQKANQLLACQQGLGEMVRIFQEKQEVREVLRHPSIPESEKKAVIHSALGEYATPLLERFMELLMHRHRFDLLGLVRQEFQDEVDRFNHVEPVKVFSALPMSEAQAKALRERLERWLGSKVRMEVQTEPTLIGGVVIQTRELRVDESLKGQLQQLGKQLAS